MKLFKVTITKEQLDKMPGPELLFFIQLTNFANEIFCLQKFTVFSASIDEQNLLVRRANNSQALFMLRLTAGKLWEAWVLLKTHFFNSTLAKEYEGLFSEETKEDLSYVKRYFGGDNLVKKVRNEYSFHYSPEASKRIQSLLKGLNGKEEFVMFFNEYHGNCFYDMADTLMNHSFFESVQVSNTKEAITQILTEVSKLTHHFLHFVGDCVLVFGKRHMGFESETIEIPDAPSLDEVCIPYFVSEPKTKKNTQCKP